jgi:Ca2+-binding RTX toxin-like protein
MTLQILSDGNDVNDGGGGNDKIKGGKGDDTFTGGTGADKFNCGKGTDSITDFNSAEGDKMSGNCKK